MGVAENYTTKQQSSTVCMVHDAQDGVLPTYRAALPFPCRAAFMAVVRAWTWPHLAWLCHSNDELTIWQIFYPHLLPNCHQSHPVTQASRRILCMTYCWRRCVWCMHAFASGRHSLTVYNPTPHPPYPRTLLRWTRVVAWL